MKTTHHAIFHFNPTMWVVLANTQFATVSEKRISGIRVSQGSAETLVSRGEITKHAVSATSLPKITKIS